MSKINRNDLTLLKLYDLEHFEFHFSDLFNVMNTNNEFFESHLTSLKYLT